MRGLEYLQGYLDGMKKYIKFENDKNLQIVDEIWMVTEEINEVLNNMAKTMETKIEMTDKQKAELLIKIAEASLPLEDKNENKSSNN